MAENTRSMTKLEDAISKIANNQTALMSSQQAMRDDIRALTLKLKALDGNFEQSLQHLHSVKAHLLASSVNLNNHPTIHQELVFFIHQGN